MITSGLILISSVLMGAPTDEARPCVLTVVGASGTPEYGEQFRRWAGLWQAAAAKAGAESIRVGEAESGATDSERLRLALAGLAKEGPRPGGAAEPVWLVLIGHGTYDGHDARFNLRGPDVTDLQLAEWLAPIRRPIAVIDCTSASAPFLSRLSTRDRVVVTATRSGFEQNLARFGQYLAESIADPAADLDKDEQVSLLEAFLTASGRVNEYYRTHAQLATEHAILDDNGDRLGTPADWFRGVRAVRRAKDGATADGIRAHQFNLVRSPREKALDPETRRRRDRVELAIAELRERKDKLKEDEYYARLETLMVELARIYQAAPQATKP